MGFTHAQLDDLAKFMIVAQEKVKAVKAEIRAIQKLNLAQEVYMQKMEEQRRRYSMPPKFIRKFRPTKNKQKGKN